jgi:hypothetical protein
MTNITRRAALGDQRGIFLPIDPHDRTGLAATIERLIALLDALDGDPDLEPWLGSGDDREDENEHGGDIVDELHDDCDEGNGEPWLGRLETVSQAAGTYAGLCPLTDAAYWQQVARPTPMVELTGAGIPVFRVR